MPRSSSIHPAFTHLLSVLKHESPLFAFKFIKNALTYIWHRYVLSQQFVVKHIHGKPMLLNLKDPGISRALFLFEDREREHRYILKRVLKPQHTVLDLGANIGYYVLQEHALLDPTKGRIIAIEPSPPNFKLLKKNVGLQRANNITLIEGAVSDTDGEAPLFLSRLSNVHSMVESNTSSATGDHITVKTYSLKTLLNTYGSIDFIRMDIEGYEQNILDSLIALHVSEDFTPAILFELHPKKYNHQKFEKTLMELSNIGYTPTYIASSNKTLLEKINARIIASIPTDGTVRHIATNLTLPQLLTMYRRSRTLLLQKI